MIAQPNLDALLAGLESACPPEGLAWLRQGLEAVRASPQPLEALSGRFPSALRHLGREPLGGALALTTPCGPLNPAPWPRGDAGRACLLLTALAPRPGETQALVTTLFRQGDEGERAALVRALCLLPDPCTLRPLALEAGRINSLHLYAALALDNPYPSTCYADHDFNQLVLKCLFNGLPVGRIRGLGGRANPELSRMCEDYLDERQAAGRTVPEDIWLALEPCASPRGLTLVLDHLGHPEPGHRYHAAVALGLALAAGRRHDDPSVAAALTRRREIENDPQVRRALAADSHDARAT